MVLSFVFPQVCVVHIHFMMYPTEAYFFITLILQYHEMSKFCMLAVSNFSYLKSGLLITDYLIQFQD